MKDESTLPVVFRKHLPPNLEKIRNGHYIRDDYDYPLYLYLKENDIRVQEEGSEIVEFLRGKNVLVTGATGFLGKLLVEKLLRSCKDIGKIYIVIRTKKGMDPHSRIEEYLDNWVFYRLGEIYPNYKEKVIGISGDFELDRLGLSDESVKILQDHVNIIYHVAATVRFDEKLKKAVKINIKGTEEMIKLAKGCKNLDVFVHVSSAFANCHEKFVKEETYPPHVEPHAIIDMTETLPEHVTDAITPGLLSLQSLPNTYALTKQIAEDLVGKEAIGIPACIHRPSIVIASATEPVRSWIDSIFGPVGLMEGGAVGLLHISIANVHGRCDMVPADFVINSMIAASYKTAKERKLDQVPVYNFTTSDRNPLLWKNLGMVKSQGVKVGSTKLLYKGFSRHTTSYYWYYFVSFLLHTIPAYIFDFLAVQFGQQPQLNRAYRKINKFMSSLAYFTLNEWKFERRNTESLWEEMNEVDKKNFNFNMTTLDWQNYFDTYLVALRELLLKEFLDNLEEGRTFLRRMDVFHYIIVTSITVLSVYFLATTIFFFIPLAIVTVLLYYLFTDEA